MIHPDSLLWKVAEHNEVVARWGMPPMPRPSYLPEEVRGQDPMVPEGTDLAVWTWESNGVPYGIAFAGKAQKPLWHYRFRNEADRERRIEETADSRRKALAYKQKAQEERRTFRHSLQVGDILVSTWGYDQTNVNFYEVVAAGDKEVTIREIGQKVVRDDGYGSELVEPTPGRYVGAPMRKRPSGSGGHTYVRLTSFSSARKWEGKPVRQTASGWGH